MRMKKFATVAIGLSILPTIALLHFLDQRVQNTCPEIFAELKAEQLAKERAGPEAFVIFSPARWLGDCHFELEGDVRSADPEAEPFNISVTLRRSDHGLPIVRAH